MRLKSLGNAEIKNLARKVMMKMEPLSMSFSEEGKAELRDKLRKEKGDEVSDKVEDILGPQSDYDIDNAIYYRNSIVQRVIGCGESYFDFNELGCGCDLTSELTLLDYYNAFEDEQLEFSSEGGYARVVRRDLLERAAYWARGIRSEQMFYYNIYSIYQEMYYYFDDLLNLELDKLIPHTYVEGPEHGKSTGMGSIFNMEVKANGKEEILKELRVWIATDLAQEYATLVAEEESNKEPTVYWGREEDHDATNNPHLKFVFNNREAMSSVKIGSFNKDVDKTLTRYADVQKSYKHAHNVNAITALRQKYEELLQTFDPKVVRLDTRSNFVIVGLNLED